MYITTTGIGSRIHGVRIDPRSVQAGDKVLLSGPIGDHGITILLARGELDIEADLSFRHALCLAAGGSDGDCGRPRDSLDARSDSRWSGHVTE